MVDRITPAGDDPLTIVCEPWRQWILEDRFAAGRPAFERVGAQFVDDVKAYEDLKVSLLNGGHSAIAHLALLLNHERVDQAMADPVVRGFLAGYWREVAAVIHAPSDVFVPDYEAALLHRFANPAIADRLARLALDTEKKLEQALVPPLRARSDRRLASPYMTTAIALWRFNEGAAWAGLQAAQVEAHLHGLRTHGVRAYVGSLAST